MANSNKTKIILALLSSLIVLFGHAQQRDYKIMRDSITKLSCKPTDSLTVAQTNVELRKINTNRIDKNLDL